MAKKSRPTKKGRERRSMADNFIQTKAMLKKYKRVPFMDGSKAYVPIVMGQEFPERAQATAELAVKEHEAILEEIKESLVQPSEEEIAEDELHDPILGDVEE